MWCKKSRYSINWNKFKNKFFKQFHGIEEGLFTEFTKVQQRRNVDEFTHEWELGKH